MAEQEKKKPKMAEQGKNKKAKSGRISRWFREMLSELRKVVWPTPKQTLNNTLVVVVMVIMVGIVIGVFDWIATLGVEALINAFN